MFEENHPVSMALELMMDTERDRVLNILAAAMNLPHVTTKYPRDQWQIFVVDIILRIAGQCLRPRTFLNAVIRDLEAARDRIGDVEKDGGRV